MSWQILRNEAVPPSPGPESLGPRWHCWSLNESSDERVIAFLLHSSGVTAMNSRDADVEPYVDSQDHVSKNDSDLLWDGFYFYSFVLLSIKLSVPEWLLTLHLQWHYFTCSVFSRRHKPKWLSYSYRGPTTATQQGFKPASFRLLVMNLNYFL